MFREGKIGFLDIFRVIEKTMEAHKADVMMTPSLDDIVKVGVCLMVKSGVRKSVCTL